MVEANIGITVEKATSNCPKCGKPQRVGANFCGDCSASLTQTTTPQPQAESETEKQEIIRCMGEFLSRLQNRDRSGPYAYEQQTTHTFDEIKLAVEQRIKGEQIDITSWPKAPHAFADDFSLWIDNLSWVKDNDMKARQILEDVTTFLKTCESIPNFVWQRTNKPSNHEIAFNFSGTIEHPFVA